MKRIIIILVIAFLCTGLMQAQTKILGRKVFDRGIQSHTFIPKGQWMVGSTFSYSEHEDDNYKFLVLEKIESTGYTFKVSPFFGYFIRDNVALGGRFSYNRTYTDLGNISWIWMMISIWYQWCKLFGAYFFCYGFVRTYMPIGSSKIFGLFNEARVTYGYGQGKNSSGTDTDYTGTYQTIQNLQIGMRRVWRLLSLILQLLRYRLAYWGLIWSGPIRQLTRLIKAHGVAVPLILR